MKLWSVASLDKNEANAIQNKYDIPAIVAMLLQIRNITSDDEIRDFLYNNSEIASPFEIKDMDKAVDRIKKAIDSDEPICVYGDYDADGVTSTALLFSYLEAMGANVMYYIPSREKEGYGMNKKAIDFLNEKGITLIITVDNGIAAVEEIAYATSLGMDTVITDHHMPQDQIPLACAVVDLHQDDCKSKFKELSGVGVAFKLIMALEGEYCDVDYLLENYADLVSIGTIGDIVQLKGENRVFVKRGLNCIMDSDRVGINSLIQSSGLVGKTIGAGNVSFTIVPRINAVGRLGSSGKSVSLLLTEDMDEADEISSQLCSDNAERQQIERNILDSVDLYIKENPSVLRDRIIVIDGENWHQGVVGIVASRIKEAFGKPVIVISRDGDIGKGSGRSVEGFPLCDALFHCSDLLSHYGGHPMAVGLTIESRNIQLFRKRINEFALNFNNMPFDRINIDCKLNPAFLSVDIAKSLYYMQPYGAGNPSPVFGLYKMKLINIIPLANNKHLKLWFSRNDSRITALKFFTAKEDFPYQIGDELDLAVTLDINEYNGEENLSVIIKDIKASSDDSEKILESKRIFEDFSIGKILNQFELANITPTREDFALLYRFLRENNGFSFCFENLMHKLDNKLTFGKIKVILEAMSELGLVEVFEGIKGCEIKLCEVFEKVSLESAQIIKKLKEVSL